jgi:hypothetical protein
MDRLLSAIEKIIDPSLTTPKHDDAARSSPDR